MIPRDKDGFMLQEDPAQRARSMRDFDAWLAEQEEITVLENPNAADEPMDEDAEDDDE